MEEMTGKTFGFQIVSVESFPYKCAVFRRNMAKTAVELRLEGWNRAGEIHVGDKIDIEGHPYLVTRADPPDEVQTTDRLFVTFDDQVQA